MKISKMLMSLRWRGLLQFMAGYMTSGQIFLDIFIQSHRKDTAGEVFSCLYPLLIDNQLAHKKEELQVQHKYASSLRRMKVTAEFEVLSHSFDGNERDNFCTTEDKISHIAFQSTSERPPPPRTPPSEHVFYMYSCLVTILIVMLWPRLRITKPQTKSFLKVCMT